MWGRCESAASKASRIQVRPAVLCSVFRLQTLHLLVHTLTQKELKKRPYVAIKNAIIMKMNIFRLRLASFDSHGKLVCSRSTGYQLLTLEKDQVSEGSSLATVED